MLVFYICIRFLPCSLVLHTKCCCTCIMTIKGICIFEVLGIHWEHWRLRGYGRVWSLKYYVNYILWRGGGWPQIITTLLAPSVIQQRHRERGEGETEIQCGVCVCSICMCAVTKMDQRDRVSRWHTVDFHPRCCFNYFGQSPAIFREYCFTKAFSLLQI